MPDGTSIKTQKKNTLLRFTVTALENRRGVYTEAKAQPPFIVSLAYYASERPLNDRGTGKGQFFRSPEVCAHFYQKKITHRDLTGGSIRHMFQD